MSYTIPTEDLLYRDVPRQRMMEQFAAIIDEHPGEDAIVAADAIVKWLEDTL